MDTTSGRWLRGGRTAQVIVVLDDYSRAVLAARAVDADSTVNNLAVLQEAVAHYGVMEVLYSDNGSVSAPPAIRGAASTPIARNCWLAMRPRSLPGL